MKAFREIIDKLLQAKCKAYNVLQERVVKYGEEAALLKKSLVVSSVS